MRWSEVDLLHRNDIVEGYKVYYGALSEQRHFHNLTELGKFTQYALFKFWLILASVMEYTVHATEDGNIIKNFSCKKKEWEFGFHNTSYYLFQFLACHPTCHSRMFHSQVSASFGT